MTVLDHTGFVSSSVGAPATRTARLRSILFRHQRALPAAVIAAIANCWALTSVGWGNAYYAAAVRSMGSSWHNFLYAAFDKGGFVAVDKPPFSLWVETISTKLFGYSQASMLAPQALLGTLSVLVLYVGVQSVWGRKAGSIAALGLAITPINVMVNHSNNTDATLVFLMVSGATLAIVAAKRGSLRWLIAAAACSGTAMTAKMLAAVPLMPAVLIAYLWCAPRKWTVRVRHVSIGLVVLAISALWWFALVDLTPKDSRPYVGSSQTNSAFQLAFERNGVNQVQGGQVFGGGGGLGARGGRGPGGFGNRFPGGGPGGGPRGSRGGFGIPRLGFNGGIPGTFRLLNAELGTQAGWLVPFALVGAVLIMLTTRLRGSPKLAAAIVFGGWALTAGAAFSITKGIVHPYYLANVGPPIAALAGIGIAASIDDVRARRVRGLAFAVAGVSATAFVQFLLLRRIDVVTWRPAARIAVVVGGLLGVSAVGALWLRRSVRIARVVVVVATIAAMAAPALWTQGAVAASLTGPLPYADPLASSGNNAGGLRPNGGFTFLAGDQRSLVNYLTKHRTTQTWTVAVSSAAQAETLIIEHGQSVMAMGGFSGSDPILTESSLRNLIAKGRLRFFLQSTGGGFGGGAFVPPTQGPATGSNLGGLLPGNATAPSPAPGGFGPLGGFGGPGGFGGRNAASTFVTSECRLVPDTEWQSGAQTSGDTSFAGGPSSATFSLYDCAALRTKS